MFWGEFPCLQLDQLTRLHLVNKFQSISSNSTFVANDLIDLAVYLPLLTKRIPTPVGSLKTRDKNTHG